MFDMDFRYEFGDNHFKLASAMESKGLRFLSNTDYLKLKFPYLQNCMDAYIPDLIKAAITRGLTFQNFKDITFLEMLVDKCDSSCIYELSEVLVEGGLDLSNPKYHDMLVKMVEKAPEGHYCHLYDSFAVGGLSFESDENIDIAEKFIRTKELYEYKSKIISSLEQTSLSEGKLDILRRIADRKIERQIDFVKGTHFAPIKEPTEWEIAQQAKYGKPEEKVKCKMLEQADMFGQDEKTYIYAPKSRCKQQGGVFVLALQ